ARAPRAAFVAAAITLSLAGVRAAVAPREPAGPAADSRAPDRDLRAEAFALAFARAYLTWDAQRPDSHERAVARFSSSSLDPGAGLEVPPTGRQRVRAVAVADDVRATRGRTVTVAADTSAGPIDLVVTVARDRSGLMFIPDYPAIVGPSAADPHAELPDEQPVEDAALDRVARRAVSNFLAAQRTNLLADLDRGAVVVLPDTPLSVRRFREMTWVRPRARVALVVQAKARSRAVMTLRY